MIRRLRAAAPTIIILGATAIAALTVAAQVAKPQEFPTVGEMHRFVVWAFLSGSGVVIIGIAGVYVWDQRRRDRTVDVVQKENARQIAELAGVVRGHHENWTMHPTGSAHRIDVFERMLGEANAALSGIQTATMTLVEGQKRTTRDLEDQEERIRAVEGTLQTLHAEHAMMHGRALVRDPLASPAKRRATDSQTGGENDSGEDFRIQRGRHEKG